MAARKWSTIGSNPLDLLPESSRGKAKGRSKGKGRAKTQVVIEPPLRAEIREALLQTPAARGGSLRRWLKNLFGL